MYTRLITVPVRASLVCLQVVEKCLYVSSRVSHFTVTAVEIIMCILCNLSVLNVVLFASRQITNSLLWMFHYTHGQTKPNPVLRVVERRVTEVERESQSPPNRKIRTREVVTETAESSKVLGLSVLTVMLTWIIKTASSVRRKVIVEMVGAKGAK